MHPVCYLAERHKSGFPASDWFTAAQSIGLHLTNQETDQVVLLDEEGDPHLCDRATLLDQIENLFIDREIVFNLYFWTTPETNVVCAIRALARNLMEVRLWIGGLIDRESEAVQEFLLNWFVKRTKDASAVLLVIDTDGLEAVWADYYWGDLALGRVKELRECPKVVGAEVGVCDAIARRFHNLRRENLGEYAVLHRI